MSLAVAAALDRLSPDQREAVVLKIYQGFKFEEMAEMLACPVSTVKSRLYTALELLKAELAPVKAKRCFMSCSPFDLRDYFLKELADPQRRQVEAHVKTCQPCREELDRLQLTESALFSLRDEEIPQRIAFVSDRFSSRRPVRRLFSDFWGSAARLGFASAAMLSAALVVFALSSTGSRTGRAGRARRASQTVATVSDAEIQPSIDAAVAKAVGRGRSAPGAEDQGNWSPISNSARHAACSSPPQELRPVADAQRRQQADAPACMSPPADNGDVQ